MNYMRGVDTPIGVEQNNKLKWFETERKTWMVSNKIKMFYSGRNME